MPCYNPLKAYRCADGGVVFSDKKGVIGELTLACGQCIGCRLERSRQWAIRCMHEASMHNENSFITLTYNETTLPRRGELVYRDYQLFMKRLRKNAPRVRFFMCGEYGGETKRPHYHACLFGKDFNDKLYFKRTETDEILYTSKELEKTWGLGMCTTAKVTFESAAYVARYCLQKQTGFNAKYHYQRTDENGEIYEIEHEFNGMSLKPGIGKEWYNKYKKDVHTHDYVIINGVKTKPPKYYDTILKSENPQKLTEIKEQREMDANERSQDNTYTRLKVKEQVAKAKISKLIRKEI